MLRVMYRLFGPLEAWRADRQIELGGPKQRAVLAVLLWEAGRVVSCDRIIEAVWGDDPPPSAVGTVQVYISNLRRVLRDEESATSPIIRQPPGYLIRVPVDQLDTASFAAHAAAAQSAVDRTDWAAAVLAAEGALALWRGAPLAEWADQDWVQVAATGLAEQRTACELNLVQSLLGLGRVDAALSAVSPVRAEQPLSERACWLQMVALYQAGRQADALGVFTDHSRLLADELGLDPGPALRTLQREILGHTPALATWPGRPHASSPARPAAASPAIPSPRQPPDTVDESRGAAPPAGAPIVDAGSRGESDIVGRRSEIAEIETALAQSRGEASRWIVITGAAGIGKSRLAEEAATRWSSAGGRVCRTQCPDDDVPQWWPIRQLIRELDAEPDAVLVPPAGVDADSARFAVYEKVSELVAAAASETPLLFLIDDVHWADRTSLRLMSYFAESQPLPDCAVVMTLRDSTGGPEVGRMLAAVARRRGTRQLPLPALSTDEVHTLANQVSGGTLDPAEARQLARRTGGNPFFVSEYARLPAEERRNGQAPLAVRSVLGRRLATVGPAVLQVLRAAALMGDRLDVELLATVTRLDRDELADLLDEAADEHIIVSSPASGTYQFAHALLRDEVTAGMSTMRRQRLHLRIAEAIGSAGTSEQLIRRASHLMSALPAADPAQTFLACRAAALDAEQRWQSDAAAQWWGHALQAFDLLPATSEIDVERDDLVVARVSALARSGQGQTVLDTVDAALLEAMRGGRTGSAGRLAACLLRASGAWPWVAHGEDPGPLFARLAGIEPLVRNDPGAHVRILAALAVGSYYRLEGNVVDELSGRAVEIAETLGDPDVLADALLGRALAFSAVAGRAAESVALLDRLAALPHALEQIDAVLRHCLLTLALMTLGRTDEVAEHVALGAVGADLLRLPVARVQLRWMEGTLALWAGDVTRAQELFDNAAHIHRQTQLYESGTHDIAMMCLRWETGRLAEQDTEVDPAFVPWGRAVTAAARDDPDADQLLAAELERSEPVSWTTHGRLTLLAHAVADRRLVDLAGPLHARLAPYADHLAHIGQVGVVGPVALALARLSQLLGDLDTARTEVARALQLTEKSGSARVVARCHRLRAAVREAVTAQA